MCVRYSHMREEKRLRKDNGEIPGSTEGRLGGREGGRGWSKGGCERSDRRRRVGGEAGERMEDLGRVSESYQRLLSLLLGIQPK